MLLDDVARAQSRNERTIDIEAEAFAVNRPPRRTTVPAGRPRYDAGLVDHQIVRLDILTASPRPSSAGTASISGLGTAIIPATTRTDLHTAKIIANGIVLDMDLTAIWDPALRCRAEVEQFADRLRASFSPRRARRG